MKTIICMESKRLSFLIRNKQQKGCFWMHTDSSKGHRSYLQSFFKPPPLRMWLCWKGNWFALNFALVFPSPPTQHKTLIYCKFQIIPLAWDNPVSSMFDSFMPIHTGAETDLRFVYCAGKHLEMVGMFYLAVPKQYALWWNIKID